MSNIVETMRRIEQVERNTLGKLAEKNKRWFDMKETIYLGKIDGKDLFRLAELDNKDNYTAILYKYFDENAQVRGIKNVRPDGLEQWVYLDEEWEELRDEIDRNEVQLEEEIEQILAQLGISKEEVNKITELDLEQEIEKKEEQEIEDKDEQEKEETKDKEDEEEIEFKQTSAYNNVLKEIDTNKEIDQKGTELGEALGLEEYGYTSLLIVHADNVRDIKDENGKYLKAETKKLAILGVREKDGKQIVEKVPESVLDYYQGANNESIRFDDNDEVEKNSNTYERFVNPKTNRGIAVEMSEMETKAYYQSGIDRDDNTAVMGRIEDTHTGWINTETKELFNSYHGIYHQDKINEEMEIHDKDNGEEIHRENADGDLDTVSEHIHEIDINSEIVYNGNLMSVQEVAQMPRFKMSPEHFVELYNSNAKKLEGKDEIDMDEVYDGIEEDVNEEIQGPQSR